MASRRCRVVVAGTGHPLMGDDAAGLLAVELLRGRLPRELRHCVLSCPMGVEHCADLVRGLDAETLIVVDASPSLEPGEALLAGPGDLQSWLPTTHNLPPGLLAALTGVKRLTYLLLGVEALGPGAGLSPGARRAAEKAADMLARILRGGDA